MELLNMMIGTMDLVFGSIVFVIVVLIESVFLSKTLAGKFIKPSIFFTVFLSNLISTLLGLIGLLSLLWEYILSALYAIFGVSEDLGLGYFLIGLLFFAWVLTLVFELSLNILVLQNEFKIRNIIINTVYANTVTYLLIGILLYTIYWEVVVREW